MIKLSNEQAQIINLLKLNYNIIVDSVAGSGKTTTNLSIAKEFNEKSILLLTYNAKLKFETRTKCINQGIENMEVHSYHSFCVKHFNKKCFTDTGIIKFFKNKDKFKKEFDYDIILIDEAQDMTSLYYKVVLLMLSLNKSDYQIGIIGDQKQSIFDFNNADSRFIKFGDEIFNVNTMEWKKVNLSISFRVTSEMANFLNYACLGEGRIKAIKNGNKPYYLLTDSFGEIRENEIYKLTKKLLKKYQPQDFFILAPSLKNEKSPCRKLENLLKKKLDIPIYVPVSDEERIDESVIRNKMVFSTFHQVKGLERKVVIIYNFDKSYFDYFKKDKNPKVCPNEMYVACTRATEELVLVHHYQNEYLPFLNQYFIKKFCQVITTDKIKTFKKNNTKNRDTKVTDLIRHLPQEVLDTALEYLNYEVVSTKSSLISIPIKTKQKNGEESISEITGIAIPTYFEMKKQNKISILDFIKQEDNILDDKEIDFVDDDDEIDDDNLPFQINEINISNMTSEKLLFISNIWNTIKSGYLFKKYQITDYNWLSQDNLDKSMERLDKLDISETANFEFKIVMENQPELFNRRLIGYLDCISQGKVYEFKCVKELSSEYILQVGCYMYLLENYIRKAYPDTLSEIEYYLYNILTDEKIKISASYDKLKEFIHYLIEKKYFTKNYTSDEMFLNLVNQIKNDYSKKKELDLKIKSNNIMILDTETTGLPKQRPFNPSNLMAYDGARMIELGYIIYDNKGKEIKRFDKLIYHKRLSIKNSFIHGITQEICRKKGDTIQQVLEEFQEDLKIVDTVICHNVNFDKNIILNEIFRSNMNELYVEFQNKNTLCTLEKTKELYGKRTKLITWYNKLFPDEDIVQTHRALDDVEMTSKCYFKSCL